MLPAIPQVTASYQQIFKPRHLQCALALRASDICKDIDTGHSNTPDPRSRIVLGRCSRPLSG